MVCNHCGKELTIKPEEVGKDSKGMPIYHRFGYCENCKAKWDLDAFKSAEPKQSEQPDKKKESVFGIIGLILSLLSCNVTIGGLALILCVVGTFSKEHKNKCGTIGLVITIFGLIVGLLAPTYLSYVDEEKKASGTENEFSIEESQNVEREDNKPDYTNENQLTKEEYISMCEEVDYKELCRNPSNYKGKKLKLIVCINQILQEGLFDDGEYYRALTNDENGWWAGDEYIIHDERIGDSTKILEDDKLIIYGEFIGMENVVRAMTATSEEIPAVNIAYMDFYDENALTEEEIAIMNDGIIDISFERFLAKYIKHEIVKSYDDTDCLLIYFEYTNKAEEATNFGSSANLSVYQNGIECDTVLFLDKDVKEKDMFYTDVRPNTTIIVAQAYEISTKDEVTVEIKEGYYGKLKDTMVLTLTE